MVKRESLFGVGVAVFMTAGCGDNGGGGSSAGTGTATTGQGSTSSAGETTGTPGTSTTSTSTTDTPTGGSDPTTGSSGVPDTTGGTTTATGGTTDATTDTTTGDSTGAVSGSSTGGGGCGACDQPNEKCVDDVCVTTCQGQDPDPCPMGQQCDIISGECQPLDAVCTLAGGYTACGATTCGPGTVCDGANECLPIAPCSAVACADGACWGALCSCMRKVDCQEPSAMLLNGPFSTEIGGIDFADDCNAWMVTLRSGPDYVRRLTPAGELTTWTGVANLNMGEVKILKRLTIPQLTQELPFSSGYTPPQPVEGLGEVAITYTCCPTCGCQANPPQGVARLDEMNVNNPLPIIIVAKATQGDGPFGSTAADAGPQGLTWGEDRVLYVGNSTNNGEYNSADLEKMIQDVVFTFDARVTASAPISPVHILVALDGGDVYRFNTKDLTAEFALDLMADVTAFSHDAFTGDVYASLSTLDVVRISPFTGEVTQFQKMPGKGRVAVSPSGKLWYTPVKYIANFPLSSWDLPMSF
jgi:hypothetical protein